MWRPASNGAGKRRWFVVNEDKPNINDRYRWGANGQLIRYASHEAASREADRLNKLEQELDA